MMLVRTMHQIYEHFLSTKIISSSQSPTLFSMFPNLLRFSPYRKTPKPKWYFINGEKQEVWSNFLEMLVVILVTPGSP